MTRTKSQAATLEVVVKVPHPRLTRTQLSALKKAFKNFLVATLAATEVGRPKQPRPPRPKRVVKRVRVTKRPPAPPRRPTGGRRAAGKVGSDS